MSVVPTGITVPVDAPIGIVVPASGSGETGLAVSWPGKKLPQTCMYPGEVCSCIAGMDSARATGLVCGNTAKISVSPRKWSAWGWVMYTYPGSQSWAFTHAASSRPSCSVMRQSTSRAPSSSMIRVEVVGGQVAGPTASSKPGIRRTGPDDRLDHKSNRGHEAQQSGNQEHPGDTEPADS